MRALLHAFLFIFPILALSLASLAVDIPLPVGKPNPDAVSKLAPADFQNSSAAPASTTATRMSANDGGSPLVGEPVELDDALKLLNKLMNFNGKVEGGKAAVIKKDIAAILAGAPGHRANALGCDKLNPLTDKDGRVQILECTLQYTRVNPKNDTKIEVHFGTDGWNSATAKIKDAVFRVVSE